jgi:hypothetical protein
MDAMGNGFYVLNLTLHAAPMIKSIINNVGFKLKVNDTAYFNG